MELAKNIKKEVKNLIPVLSEKERQEIIAYHTVYEQHEAEFSKQATEELMDHPVFGKLIKDIPKDITEARNKVSRELQREAIYNNNWEPYIQYQIEQGVTYAKMGLGFKSWYEVIAMVRKYITPYLLQEYGTGDEFLGALNGMRSFMDIAMCTIGVAYLQEKNEIIRLEREEISKANSEKESVMNRISDGILSIDNDWRYTFLNDAALATHPLGREKTLGKTLWEVHPELAETIFGKAYQQAMDTRKVVEVENYYAPMDTWFSVKIYPSSDGITIFFRDVTESKKAEEALRLSEAKYRNVVENIHEALIVEDRDGNLIYANPEFYTMFGYSPDETGILTFRDYTSPESYAEVAERHNNRIKGMKVAEEFEYKGLRKDGTEIWIEARVSSVIENGEIVGTQSLERNITERKKAEAEIRALTESLEKKVIERTGQLEEANNELEAFSYSVSHDLRAPLRAINGYARILEEDYHAHFDDEGKRLLAVVQENATKMGVLIDDLLTFSRLGKKGVNSSTIDMNLLAENAIAELRKSQDFKTKIKIGKLHPAMADVTLMNQVWLNLISNAIKYSLKGDKPAVEISSEKKDGELVYAVTDNGVGFDMEYAHKLFGVFQRLHSAEEFEGTGVGLALVHRIISKHGGKVWAKGEIGKGATFYFSLPDKNK